MDEPRQALEKHLDFWERIKIAISIHGSIDADDFTRAASAAGLVTVMPRKTMWIDNAVAKDALAQPNQN